MTSMKGDLARENDAFMGPEPDGLTAPFPLTPEGPQVEGAEPPAPVDWWSLRAELDPKEQDTRALVELQGVSPFDLECILDANAEMECTDLPGVTVDDEAICRLYRYVRARLRIESELDAVKAQAATMVRALEARLHGLEFVHHAFCSEVVKAQLQGKKTKSIKTPYGTVGFRAGGGNVTVRDADALVAAAQQDEFKPCVEAVTTHKPVLAAIKEHLERTGELPPGCDITDKTDRFYVQAPRVKKEGQ